MRKRKPHPRLKFNMSRRQWRASYRFRVSGDSALLARMDYLFREHLRRWRVNGGDIADAVRLQSKCVVS